MNRQHRLVLGLAGLTALMLGAGTYWLASQEPDKTAEVTSTTPDVRREAPRRQEPVEPVEPVRVKQPERTKPEPVARPPKKPQPRPPRIDRGRPRRDHPKRIEKKKDVPPAG
jgi:hypothetical protein